MNIWLIRDAEVLPIDQGNQRLARMALIAEMLCEAGDKIIWWTSTFNHFAKEFRKNTNHKVKVKPNYDIFLLKTFGYKKNVSLKRLAHNWKIATEFLKFAEAENKKPDVIVVDLPTISFVVKAIKYGKRYNVPVIVDVRDLHPEVFQDAFAGIKRIVVKVGILPLQYILRKAMKKATAIVGTTQPYLDYGLKYACRKQRKNDKVFFVSYPDNKMDLKEDSINKWKKYKLDDRCVICFFGQFGNMVDVDTVIDAARICEKRGLNATFMLCGNGEKVETYKNKIRDLSNIYFPGWVNKDDIRALGAISTAGLMAYKPSKNYELQMPNKFSEYLSFGLVILVQPDGIMKDVIQRQNCGFAYKSPKDLANAVQEIVEKPQIISDMKLRARQLYEKEFCAEIVYKKYAQFIHEIGEKNEI